MLSRASRAEVLAATSGLGARLKEDRWLTLSNRYRKQAPSKIRAQLGTKKRLLHTAGTPAATQLAEYVAASTILHCSDGWAYVGRAMAAQLRGDLGAARHLAYYAELRAAISLLAAQGIGVFANIHVVLRDGGDVELFRHEATHRFTWNALEAWTELPESGELFTEIIQPAEVPFAGWLRPLAGDALAEETGRRYLRFWGVDVKRFGRDRDARNDSSYQPRTILGAPAPSSARAAEFSRDFWALFEPNGSTKFGLLDRYLLRRTLKQMFTAKTGKSADSEKEKFIEYFDPILDGIQASEPEDQMRSFLSGETFSVEPPLFREAESRSEMEDPEDHLRVIARGALLLRVASGAARQLLAGAGLTYPEFEWWARQIAASRALVVDAHELLADPQTLWGDIDQALDDLGEKIADGEAETYADLNGRCAEELTLLGGCERIALWALAA